MINAAERNVIEMADAIFGSLARPRRSPADLTSVNGYDYQRQAWVKDGRYLRCGHPPTMDCRCYGLRHEGEMISPGAIQDIH